MPKGLTLILFAHLVCLSVLANQPPDFVRSAKAVTANGQKIENAKLFFAKDDTGFGASVVVGSKDQFEKFDGIIIQFSGVGGNIEQYGAMAQSTLNFCGVASKLGLAPMAFENPIYFGARDFDRSGRIAQADRFSVLQNQIDWYTSTIERVIEHNPGKKIYPFGRSTGASTLAWWYLQGARGDERIRRCLSKIPAILLGGITGYQEDIMKVWTEVEDRDIGNDAVYDAIATQADRKLYKQMRESEFAAAPTDFALPTVIAIGAGQDETMPLEAQQRVVARYSELAPSAPIVFLKSDAKHDPTKGYQLETPDRLIDVRQSQFFKDVLRTFVLNPELTHPAAGLHQMDLRFPLYPASIEDLKTCGAQLLNIPRGI